MSLLLKIFVAACGCTLLLGTARAEESTRWSLEAAIGRALEVAPEARAAAAEVAARAGELAQTRAWPNPRAEAHVGDRISLENDTSGYDLTQYGLVQPLPLARRGAEPRQAQAQLDAAEAKRLHDRLKLEAEVARTFHQLQAATAKWELARERLQVAERFASGDRDKTGGDRLVRYLTPLERLRLGIIHASARQALDTAEGELAEARSHFRAQLALPAGVPVPTPLAPPAVPAELSIYVARLAQHPGMLAGRGAVAASEQGVALARARRFNDPELRIARERDIYAGREQTATVVGVSVQVPLWNQHRGDIARAEAEVDQARAALAGVERDLAAQLAQSHAHLQHLIDQALHYREQVMAPTDRMYALTRRAFAAGEVNVLTLIDAHDTYFGARERYVELSEQAWRELAALRLAAGISVLEGAP
ncbi:MAG: TolC family protein [Gammaproteobacteria bacterium]